jgi:hypothetical protein
MNSSGCCIGMDSHVIAARNRSVAHHDIFRHIPELCVEYIDTMCGILHYYENNIPALGVLT